MEKVKIYSKNGCNACITTKAFLDAKGIPYEIIDIDEDKDACQELISAGLMSLPYVKIGDKGVQGFRPNEILKAVQEIKPISDL